MSALGHTYRWQIYNGTGVSVGVTLKTRAGKYGSDGAFGWGAEATGYSNLVTAGSYASSDPVANATDKYTQAEVMLQAAPAGTPAAGSVLAVYLQRSTDGGSTWPDNGTGVLVAAISFAAAATVRQAQGMVR